MDKFQLSQDYIITARGQFSFNHYVPRNSRYSFDPLQQDEGCVDPGVNQWDRVSISVPESPGH